MATSNSTDFQSIASDLIRDALEDIGYLGAEESVQQDDYNTCLRRLNRLLKHWQTYGLNLYALEEASIPTKSGGQSYTLSSTGDHASTNLIQTELSAAGDTLDTTLTVDSTTGMTAAANIGIELDDDTIQWTTIVSVDSATTLTITTALTGAAAIDNNIYVYTTKLKTPLDIIDARYTDDNGTAIRMRKISRSEYFNMPDKAATGQPLMYYYDRQATTGKLYVYPVAANMSGTIDITTSRETHDIDATTDNFDVPKQAELALEFGLAVICGPAFGRTKEAAALKPLADQYLNEFLSWDNEHASLHIFPRTGFKR